jgi:HSP20 family protein
MANQLTRWEPFESALRLRDAMDRLFEESFFLPSRFFRDTMTSAYGTLPIDMYETADEIVVNAVLPGVKSENVNVQFQDGRLIIDVDLPAPKTENVTYHWREIGYGQFHREVTLPAPVKTDKVEAVLENGFLTLHLPKVEEVKPKKIQIKTK